MQTKNCVRIPELRKLAISENPTGLGTLSLQYIPILV